MSDDFTAVEMQVLRDLIATEQQRQADDRARSLEEFQNILTAAVTANANMIDTASATAGDGDTGLVAVAVAIGAPLSGYNLSDWPVLKGWIWDRLFDIRAQRFVGLP